MKRIIRAAIYAAIFASCIAVFFRVAAATDSPSYEADSQVILKPSAIGDVGPIRDDLFHVQGLAFSTDTIFISSVDKKHSAAMLWKLDRKTLKGIMAKNFADNFMYHPSGLQFDGRYLWMAVAVYTAKSNSKVLRIDPVTFKILGKFAVADHIGLVASDGNGRVYGGNWDARKFYIWNEKGTLIAAKDNPTEHGYQDCKARGGMLICSGGGHVDFIDIASWKVVKSLAPGQVSSGNDATREGMEIENDILYFLPDDDKDTRIYKFRINQ